MIDTFMTIFISVVIAVGIVAFAAATILETDERRKNGTKK